MFFNYSGTKVHYKCSGKREGKVLVLLHGWGCDIDAFKVVGSLKKDYKVVELSFPPFGKSDEPEGWNIFSYANMVISLCEHLNIEKACFLGHSFGGRVAILISVIQPQLVEKLVLVDSAGMKPRRKISYYIKTATYKVKKKLGLKIENLGSKDYVVLSPNMKRVFTSIVSTHLEEYASMIKQKTLIIFGEADKETPLYMARRLNKLIKNSTLVVMKNCGHFCYLEKPYEFNKLVTEFLRS